MRWDDLFADLEAQLAAAGSAELAGEVADRTRREHALLALGDRARGSCGSRVSVRVEGAGVIEGVLTEVGAQWLLVQEPAGHESLVALPAVLVLTGLGPASTAPGSTGRVGARLGLSAALRAVARDRARVTVRLRDGSTVSGTVDRVGADFLEVTDRDPDGPAGRGPRAHVVAQAALAVVRR